LGPGCGSGPEDFAAKYRSLKKLVEPGGGEDSRHRDRHPLSLTLALEELVSRGHSLNDLLDGYPVELVKNLYRASRENRRRSLVEATLGFSVAVCNALDLALAGGKGKVLETWLKGMEEAELEKTDPRPGKRLMSSRALQWVRNLPLSKETKVNG